MKIHKVEIEKNTYKHISWKGAKPGEFSCQVCMDDNSVITLPHDLVMSALGTIAVLAQSHFEYLGGSVKAPDLLPEVPEVSETADA